MTSNTFFLRETYTHEEMINRIHSSEISVGNSDFDSVIDRYDSLDLDSFRGISKSDFFRRVSTELEEDFEDFVEQLYEECGQPGDTFNLQLFELPEERDYTAIYSLADNLDGSRLDDLTESVDENLLINKSSVGDDYVDLSFKTAEKVQDIEPDEDLKVVIERADSGEVEAKYGPEYLVRAPSQDVIEARIYPGDKIVAVSNGSGINDGTQNAIVNGIIELGEN